MEIVEADLVGAFEGAIKAVNYVVDKELSEDEAIAVIVTSAITHAVARSHVAYVNRLSDRPKLGYAAPFCKDYTENPECLRKDIVSLSKNELVQENNWMNKSYPLSEYTGVDAV